jgi:hypothetical protein
MLGFDLYVLETEFKLSMPITAEVVPAAVDARIAYATRPSDGDTATEALARLQDIEIEIARLRAELRARIRDGTPPRADMSALITESLKRNATWLYRSRVRGESTRAIARDAFGDDALERHKDVRGSIRSADHWLSVRCDWIEPPPAYHPHGQV